LPQLLYHRFRIAGRLDFKIHVVGAGFAPLDDFHAGDVSPVPRDHAGHRVQNPRT